MADDVPQHAPVHPDHADPHTLDSQHLPTPFSAEEIRAGCPAGRTVRTLLEPAGEPPTIRVTRFVEVDADGCETEDWTEGPDGSRTAGERGRATWLELQGHASFPADRATRDRVLLTTRLGELWCARYTVRRDDGGVSQLWFDLGRPGMPVAAEHFDAGSQVELTATVLADDVER